MHIKNIIRFINCLLAILQICRICVLWQNRPLFSPVERQGTFPDSELAQQTFWTTDAIDSFDGGLTKDRTPEHPSNSRTILNLDDTATTMIWAYPWISDLISASFDRTDLDFQLLAIRTETPLRVGLPLSRNLDLTDLEELLKSIASSSFLRLSFFQGSSRIFGTQIEIPSPFCLQSRT